MIRIAVVLACVVVSAITIAAHERARSAWEEERARQGSAAYDAARSDAAWDAARELRTVADRAALIGACVVLLAASASRRARDRDAAPASEGGRRDAAPAARTIAATAIDAATIALGCAAARALATLPSSPAIADALGWWLPGAVLAAHATALARGATLGMRASGLRASAAPWWRIAIAVLATAPVLVVLPVVALAGARWGAWAAPHLAIAGIASFRV